VVRAHAW